ncbi:hypothetical protein C2E20_6606 [Micractinium conductrix]|uniref:Uncharacterized protein n=1 Tax=Micractinium conductrix TaxID=554055 RepID=A0A2P6V6Z8_9CHLO|nr:hypothetical protein C2E20_6606 [Micractinium conductrix]|eukprot:PSC69848.1 hypothetical protein C2E20_6606 [Micractinium conductrix]
MPQSLSNVLVVVKRRLGQLQASQAHTTEDLRHYRRILDDVDGRWRDEEGTFAGRLAAADPKAAALCSRLFNECFDMLEAMQHTTAEMPADLQDMHGRLVALQAQLAKMQADADHTLADVLPLQEQLDAIDTERLSKNGSFATGTAPAELPGESACNEARRGSLLKCRVLNHCYELLAACMRAAEDVSPEMKDVYDRLRSSKNALSSLLGKRRHTAEDLRHWQAVLEKIDAERVDGVFCGNLEKGVIPHGQAAASKLLDECYDLIERLTDSAEGMGPEMKRIHTQLEQHELEGLLRRQRTVEEVKALQVDCGMLHDLYADLAAVEAGAEQ